MRFRLEDNIKFVSKKYSWINIENYRRIMLALATMLMIISALLYISIFLNIVDAIIAGLVSGAIVILLFYYYPYSLRLYYQGRIEKELPYFLLDLDIKLSVGQDFISSLKSTAKDYSELGEIVSSCVLQYERGVPFHKSFLQASSFFELSDLSRALIQIQNIYLSGYNTKSGVLLRLAEELLTNQKTKIKLYNSKLVMISLLFIGITALLPSLFLVFVSVGGAVLDLGITGKELLYIFIILFPLIDILMIVVVYNLMPEYVK